MKTPKPILVSGSHRSGTTWAGRMIASSPAVAYIHEPFHARHDPGICKAQFKYWFTYVCEENENEYYPHIKNTLSFRYNLADKFSSARHPGHIIAGAGKYAQFMLYRMSGLRPLLKDPIALFSAEWLSSRFNTANVIMIRHPAAFAGSLKDKNWTHPFSHFINQPLLMQHHLKPFEKEIKAFAEEEKDIVDQAALLWKLIHYMILKYKKHYPDWIYVRHEDLSKNPLNGFRFIFNQLNLEFTDHTAKTIKKHAFAKGSKTSTVGGGTRIHDLKRNSLTNIHTWKERLTHAEIERVKSRVREISREFYSDEEWQGEPHK